MAALTGTVIASKIVPTDSLDQFATHDADYGRGGHRSVQTLAERDAITMPRRKIGMLVTVVDDNYNMYQLVGGIENANWTKYSSGGEVPPTPPTVTYEPVSAFNPDVVRAEIIDGDPTNLRLYMVNEPQLIFAANGDVIMARVDYGT